MTKKILNKRKYICVDKSGYPVEGKIGKPIKTFIRKLLLTRKIKKIVDVERDQGITISYK